MKCYLNRTFKNHDHKRVYSNVSGNLQKRSILNLRFLNGNVVSRYGVIKCYLPHQETNKEEKHGFTLTSGCFVTP